MAENLTKKPAKGILKHSKSLDQHDINRQQDIKWDEMNILQTLHPADKDYGHMTIDEPKTPYNYYKDEDLSGTEKLAINPSLLAEKIQEGAEKPPKVMTETSSSEEEEDETEEERAKRKLFEYKRKTHYNEFYAVKLARKLMSADEDEDEDEEEEESNSNVESSERQVENKNCSD
ncbi:protein phosphatase inhibitor 2-like [Centruroides sculpturatus]|uniref:protein phosphatase inhibitor 2-like n=1 Tax=Centruroides sculpturatus TaxID=218467 RepID=UPI000C6D5DD4|nr:protein phosphatase inhibitor 2-like [Centruroides sculpturatus]